jgi:quinol monooxygenase YgiN
MTGRFLRTFLGTAALALGIVQAADGQTDEAAYIVTYIEVLPSATEPAIRLISAHATASRNAEGNVRFLALQRIRRPNHFALLETWTDAEARAAHASASHTRTFRANLEPLLYSPYDERPHVPLDVASAEAGSASALYALTHVDITPNNLEVGVERVRAVIVQSRRDAGNQRFDGLSQSSRRNHLTLVEAWESEEAQAAHAGTDHSRSFRAALLPLSGSLYDERLYRQL